MVAKNNNGETHTFDEILVMDGLILAGIEAADYVEIAVKRL